MSEVVCPNCESPNEFYRDKCFVCGASLEDVETTDREGSVYLGFTATELSLASISVRRYALDGSTDHTKAAVDLLIKLDEAIARAKKIGPHDATLVLTTDQAYRMQWCVSNMLGDAIIARSIGGAADALVGGVWISELAENAPTLRDISRRLETSLQIALQEDRITELEARVEALEKELFDL
jgi:hypothetical protein